MANIKIPSDQVKKIKELTGEATGQKAVETALLYFLKEARQRRITKVLESIQFDKTYNPLKLRQNER